MRVLWVMLVGAQLVCCLNGGIGRPLSDRVRDFDVVRDFYIREEDSRLHVGFDAFNERFRFTVSRNVNLFKSNSKLHFYDGEDKLIKSLEHADVAYEGTSSHGVVRVTKLSDSTIHAVFRHEHEMVVVDVAEDHPSMLGEHRSLLGGGQKMIAYKLSDMDGHVDSPKCGLRTPTDDVAVAQNISALAHKRRLHAVFDGCPTTMQSMTIGLALNWGYVRAAGGADLMGVEIAKIMNSVNGLFADQFNVFMYVGPTKIMTGPGGPAWNVAPTTSGERTCTMTTGAHLDDFGEWRGGPTSNTAGTAMDEEGGLWHLLTDCFPAPGTVGLAAVGVLCRKSSAGTGWTSFNGAGTWSTVAHELGHNFDAGHTADGIMGASKGTGEVFVGENALEVCPHIQNTLTSSTNCLEVFAAVCGNGVVEPGEECDDSTFCCTSCQWSPGAQCSSGECCESCRFLPTTSLCDGDLGFCHNGFCEGSACNRCSNCDVCAMTNETSCTQTCDTFGTCRPYDEIFTGTRGVVADGAICSTAPLSRCSSGVCIEAPDVEYFWFAGQFSECACVEGNAVQERAVVCQSSLGTIAAASLCAGAPPALSQGCEVGCDELEGINGGSGGAAAAAAGVSVALICLCVLAAGVAFFIFRRNSMADKPYSPPPAEENRAPPPTPASAVQPGSPTSGRSAPPAGVQPAAARSAPPPPPAGVLPAAARSTLPAPPPGSRPAGRAPGPPLGVAPARPGPPTRPGGRPLPPARGGARPAGRPPPPPAAPVNPHSAGDRVNALYAPEQQWYPAKVVRTAGATTVVVFDGFTEEEQLELAHVSPM